MQKDLYFTYESDTKYTLCLLYYASFMLPSSWILLDCFPLSDCLE